MIVLTDGRPLHRLAELVQLLHDDADAIKIHKVVIKLASKQFGSAILPNLDVLFFDELLKRESRLGISFAGTVLGIVHLRVEARHAEGEVG